MKIALLGFYNILDAFLTLHWVRIGAATEGNPIMAWFLSEGEGSFLFAKIVATVVACGVFHLTAQHKISRNGLTFVLGLYTMLMFVHICTALIS
jgi:hypothetical protein